MSTAKTCRNCGGNDFYQQLVKANANGVFGPHLLPLGVFTGGEFRLRVCGHCGLVEWFVPHPYLEKVREKFTAERHPGLGALEKPAANSNSAEPPTK